MAAANDVVRARIDRRLKQEAAAVLEGMGLSVSDAVRMMLVRVAAEKRLPFSPLRPNATTVKAMKAARAGKVARFETLDDLMTDLNAK